MGACRIFSTGGGGKLRDALFLKIVDDLQNAGLHSNYYSTKQLTTFTGRALAPPPFPLPAGAMQGTCLFNNIISWFGLWGTSLLHVTRYRVGGTSD